jgi:hypothetical protein
MTAIWSNDGERWALLAPSGFPDEATLHTLIEQTPQLLPLAGSPRLTIVGREVRLGTGSADLVAVEPNGRLVVIEVKLAYNAEARRAVVAQVLTYAAYLHGVDRADLERGVLGGHLQRRGHDNLISAVVGDDQERSLDTEAFDQGLAESLADGRFRIVIVLDAAPAELVRLVGYLEAVTDKLLIDLVTVSAYDVNGSRILVPQRVEPERWRPEAAPATATPRDSGYGVPGAEDFLAVIADAPQEQQVFLRRLAEWAIALGKRGLVPQLSTYHGKAGITTLLLRLSDGRGLVTIYKDTRSAYLQLFRSVFERRAPRSLAAVEAAIGEPLRQGNVVYEVSDQLLAALTAAYEEAGTGQLPT